MQLTSLAPEMATIAMAAYGSTAPKAAVKMPKLYICGFPKSGLHLADRMAVAMLAPWKPEHNWYGSNAWTTERHNLKQAAVVLGSLKRGQYIKGHLGYLRSIERLMQILGIAVVFVYRDLRDVVVSQAYHMMSDSDALNFKGRERYQDMDKLDVMKAVITGDDTIPGIFDRWETFAGWLDCDGVLPLPYEEMRKHPERAAATFFDYVYGWALRDSGITGSMTDNRIRQAVISCIRTEMKHTEMSVTYRKGKAGGYKKEFTPELYKTFEKADTNGWMERLGYTQ